MEKVIKLNICEDKSIKIFVNNDEKHTIEAKDRSITAAKIYEIIDFSSGDHYTVESEDTPPVDKQVLDFFVDLLKDITEKVNNLSIENGDNNSSDTLQN